MSEYTELWSAIHDGAEAEISKVDDGYVLEFTNGRWSGYPSITLDRKDLKDLFNAIGNELNMWWDNVSMNEVKYAGAEVEGTPVKGP